MAHGVGLLHGDGLAQPLVQAVWDLAAGGLPAWVVLDDPTQSLDETLEQGLAEAVAKLSERVPVLLATCPGPLSRRLADTSQNVVLLRNRGARAQAHPQRAREAHP